MPKYVITPWKHDSELLQVRREMFQLEDCVPPADLRRHAVDWIDAWKMRGNLPHPIDSTGQLVDAVLHHDASKNSPFSIRATYSAAFCRFVTGFTDVAQSGGPIKKSMYQIAKEISMPASFVELRHEATHGDLPSLPRLERHVKLALEWLWEHYWSRISYNGNGSSAVGPERVEERLRPVLNGFLAKRKQEIKKGVSDMSKDSASGTTCAEIVTICLGEVAALKTLARILVEAKMLIPASRVLNESMAGAFVVWGNLLRRLSLHQTQFLKVLVARVVEVMSRPSGLDPELDPAREAAYEWLLQIFTARDWSQAQLAKQFTGLKPIVLEECLSAPNRWSLALGNKLLGAGAGSSMASEWGSMLRFAEKARTEYEDSRR